MAIYFGNKTCNKVKHYFVYGYVLVELYAPVFVKGSESNGGFVTLKLD